MNISSEHIKFNIDLGSKSIPNQNQQAVDDGEYSSEIPSERQECTFIPREKTSYAEDNYYDASEPAQELDQTVRTEPPLIV